MCAAGENFENLVVKLDKFCQKMWDLSNPYPEKNPPTSYSIEFYTFMRTPHF